MKSKPKPLINETTVSIRKMTFRFIEFLCCSLTSYLTCHTCFHKHVDGALFPDVYIKNFGIQGASEKKNIHAGLISDVIGMATIRRLLWSRTGFGEGI